MGMGEEVYVSGAKCPVCLNVSDHVKVRGGAVLCTICSTELIDGLEEKVAGYPPEKLAEALRPFLDWFNSLGKVEEEEDEDFCVVCKSTDCRYDGMHPLSPRADMLREAERIVDGDRNVQYGDPRADFQRTATMWGAYLGVEIQPQDVAAMMALLKISRIRWSPEKRDSWVDLAGYAACGWHCVAPEEE
jgi:hypothetical protein